MIFFFPPKIISSLILRLTLRLIKTNCIKMKRIDLYFQAFLQLSIAYSVFLFISFFFATDSFAPTLLISSIITCVIAFHIYRNRSRGWLIFFHIMLFGHLSNSFGRIFEDLDKLKTPNEIFIFASMLVCQIILFIITNKIYRLIKHSDLKQFPKLKTLPKHLTK